MQYAIVALIAMFCGVGSLWDAFRSDIENFPKRSQRLPWISWLVLPTILGVMIWMNRNQYGALWMAVGVSGFCLAVAGVIALLVRRALWLRGHPIE